MITDQQNTTYNRERLESDGRLRRQGYDEKTSPRQGSVIGYMAKTAAKNVPLCTEAI